MGLTKEPHRGRKYKIEQQFLQLPVGFLTKPFSVAVPDTISCDRYYMRGCRLCGSWGMSGSWKEAQRTFERAISSQGLLQLLVDLPVERAPDGCDVGFNSLLQMNLLAKLFNHEGLAQGRSICCMLFDPSLQEIDIPCLQHTQNEVKTL